MKEQDDLVKATKRLESEAKMLRTKGKRMQETAVQYLAKADKIEALVRELAG